MNYRDLDKEKIYIFKNNNIQEKILTFYFKCFENSKKIIITILAVIIIIFFFYYIFRKQQFDIKLASAEKIKIIKTTTILSPTLENPLNLFPHWLPSGDQIVFITSSQNEYSINLANSDSGGKIKKILRSQKPINWLTKHSIFEINKEPVCSPDGKYIAYISNKTGINEIWLTDLTGKFQRQITNSPVNKSAPNWSPDGKYLVYQIFENNTSKIQIVGLDGEIKDLILRYRFDINEAAPSWSPDGRYIVYTSNASGKYEIWLYDIANRVHKQLTNTIGNSGAPAFSPDSQKIIFLSEIDNNIELFIININGGGMTRLTQTLNINELTCSFSPDGNKILVSCAPLKNEAVEIKLLELGWKD